MRGTDPAPLAREWTVHISDPVGCSTRFALKQAVIGPELRGSMAKVGSPLRLCLLPRYARPCKRQERRKLPRGPEFTDTPLSRADLPKRLHGHACGAANKVVSRRVV